MPKYPKFQPMSIVTHQAMKENGGVPFQVPMLTSSNYTSWSIKMEAIMDAQGVWESIEPRGDAAIDEKKNKVARAFIFQTVPEDVLLQIAKKKSAMEIWESLKTRYLGADRVQKARLQTLKSDFEALRMKEGETIDEFAGKLSGMATKCSSLGATLEDEALVRKLLNSVPDKFLQLVASIEQYSDLDTMPFEEAIGRMKAYEERIKPRSGSPERQLLLTHTEWQERQKQSVCESSSSGKGHKIATSEGRGGHRGHGRGNCGGRTGSREDENRSNGKTRDKSHIKCFNCQCYGHFASECTKPRRKEEEANLIHTQEDEPALLMLTCMEEKGDMSSLKEVKGMTARQVTKLEQQEAVWYLDNGASNHMTGNLSNFIELDKAVKGWVRFGDNSKVQIMGIGSILLQCKNGEQRLITEVYFIPSLCHNILSLGQITEEGGKVEMLGHHLCVFNKDGRLFIKVQRTSNRLYKVNLQATKPLELVHADLCGPITQNTSAARIKFAEDEGDSRCEKSQGAMSGSRGRMLELILPYCMIAAAASNSENGAAVKQDKESATKTWLVQLQVMEESGHHARSVQQLKMEVEQPSGECGAVQQQHYELWGSAASYGGMLQVVQQCFKTMKRWKTCCKVQLQGSGEVAASSAALTTQHSVERFSGNAGAIAAARSCKGGDAAVRNMEQLQDRAWSAAATWGLHGLQKQRKEVLKEVQQVEQVMLTWKE